MNNLETNIQNATNPNLFKRLSNLGGKLINYKVGLIGAGVMGSIVFGINYHDTHELLGASTAALKQGGYTFLIGGNIMRGCEYLATKIKKETIALAAAIIIPSIISIGLTYGIHNLKGTPKPLKSTIPTATLIIPSTAVWGYKQRKKYNQIKEILIQSD